MPRFRPTLVQIAGLALALMAALAPAARAADDAIQYRLMPVLTGGQLAAVQVTMSFEADKSGRTELDLPDRYAGHDRLYEALKDVTVDGAQEVTAPEPRLRIIQSKAHAKLTVHYRLDANLPAKSSQITGSEVLPAIGPDRLNLIGWTVFASVAGRDHAPARFTWLAAPGWRMASDLEHLPKGATQLAIQESVILASPDLRIVEAPTSHSHLRIATFGAFGFDQPDFVAAVRRIVETEQTFWGDGQPDFLVTLAPLRAPGGQAYTGLGLGDAFAMMVSPGIGLDQLKTVLSHEYFHSWDPAELGGPETGGSAAGAWFGEGFTDYYARRLALRGGIIDLAAFAKAWNEVLNTYAASPQITAPNSAIAEGFWTNHDLQALAYDRGAILAAWLEAKWRAKNVSLDEVMHTLRDQAKRNPGIGKQSFADRLEGAAGVYGVTAKPDIDRYIVHGERLTLPGDAFGGCLSLQTETVHPFTLGYDAEKTSLGGDVFAGVDPQGPAYAAGLRDGMHRLARLSGDLDDPSTPVSFRVQMGAEEQVITYLPQAARTVTRQRMVLPAGLAPNQIDACKITAAGI